MYMPSLDLSRTSSARRGSGSFAKSTTRSSKVEAHAGASVLLLLPSFEGIQMKKNETINIYLF